MRFMKDKEFTNVRKWIVNNIDNDNTRLFRRLYDNLYDYMDCSSILRCCYTGEYQYKVLLPTKKSICLCV